MAQILQIKPYFVNSFEYVISYESLHLHFYFFIGKLWDHSNFIWSEYTLTHAEAVSQRWPATLLKKGFWHRCFPVNFAKVLRAPFLIEHLRLLLLHMISFWSVFLEKNSFFCPKIYLYIILRFYNSVLIFNFLFFI